MVWFQCEVCGEELKKPKLPNHFRICSAYKLSCIDCGVTFDKQTVQSHTQCITEAEKYGPKGQAKVATPGKPNKDKLKPDVDINVGLSTRYPWFCSLCNSQATSQQALLLHGDGKKHRAKVRAFVAKQQPPEEAAPTDKDSAENNVKDEVPNGGTAVDKKENSPSKEVPVKDDLSVENGNASGKKRKKNASSGDGNATQVEVQETIKKAKKAKHETEVSEKKKAKRKAKKEDESGNGVQKESSKGNIKWKKLISSLLESAPDKTLKMKKLRKLALKSVQESAGSGVDDSLFSKTLEDKVNSSSRFTVDGKYVKFAA